MAQGDQFVSDTDVRAALDAFREACLELPAEVVAREMSQVLVEGQEPDATRSRTMYEGLVRVISDYLIDKNRPDTVPDWLTPAVMERVSQRLRSRSL